MEFSQGHLEDADWAARFFRTSRDRIYQMVRARQIPSVKVGKRIYFDPRQIEAFIERGGRGPIRPDGSANSVGG